ncbi:MAG: hypothetical protein U9O78_01905 [Patescibacteria group bacterium]|nr:hypothetical protein [Patescibacteria group bacterium]
MKKANLTASLFLLFTGLIVAVSPAFAQNQAAEEEQTYEVECEVYADGYGESSSTCYVTGEQYQELSQSQEDRVVYIQTADAAEIHVPVDTALDFKSTLAAASTMFSGLVALVIKLKNRV